MKIYILGCGALGSNIAMNLAFDRRDDDLVLVDFDKVEPRNYQFGTQQYTEAQNGLSKVEALRFNIYQGARNNKVAGIDERVENINLETLNSAGLMVDCFDNYYARASVASDLFSCERIHVGFSPLLTFEVMWNEVYEVPDDPKTDFDICEAQGARSFIQYVSGLASTAIIDYLDKGEKYGLLGNRYTVNKLPLDKRK